MRAAQYGGRGVDGYLLEGDVVILLGRHYFGPAEVVQDPDVGYVQLGEEPVVAGRPGSHLRVPGEQRLLGHVPLCLVHLRDTREMDVLEAGTGSSASRARFSRPTDPTAAI